MDDDKTTLGSRSDSSAPLDILIVSDLHRNSKADSVAPGKERRCDLGAILLRKALHRLHHLGVKPQLVIILGDILDDSESSSYASDIAEIAAAIKQMGVRVLVVRGNHDGTAPVFEETFNGPGLHEIDGYGFVVFNDKVIAGDFTTRVNDDLLFLQDVASKRPDLPLVALQHNPIFPRIESEEYPYMLTNAEEVLEGYKKAGVFLSLSGHYHVGQKPDHCGRMTTYTVPALCESPFKLAHVRLQGKSVEIREHHLKMDEPGLFDVHCHTEYAYCATSVSAKRCLRVSEALGMGGICLTEHAFHLYFPRKDAWSFRWQTDNEMVEKAWRERDERMDDYKSFAIAQRNDGAKLGLEVDLRSDGTLLLSPQDTGIWDILVGAVHEIPGFKKGETSQADAEKMFLGEIEKFMACPIQVLAHPFRFFRKAGLDAPVQIYPIVAHMLAECEIAAEINFHTNNPDPAFIEECLLRNVKMALGSDSHDIIETGEFLPHLMVLQKAGVKRDDYSKVLYRYGE